MNNRGSQTRRALTAADLLGPWAAFLAMLAWAWRVGDLFHSVSAYSDTLEVLWGLEWYGQSLSHWHNPLYYSAVFAPQGWQVATLAHGPALFLALLPLYALGGAAFAYNIAALVAHGLAFAGLFKVARRWLRPGASTLAALAFTFWEYRWFRNSGHLHTLIASALLPWLVWTWDQARRHPARATRWQVITGVIWALSLAASLYSLWHSLVLLLVWGLAQVTGRQISWRAGLKGYLLAGLTALGLSSPTLWLFWRGLSTSLTRLNSVESLVIWSASLNSLPIPSLAHVWLAPLAQRLDHGPFTEAEVANFGLGVSLTALLGAWAARQDKRLWPLLAGAGVGLTLALGPVVKISGEVVTVSWLNGLDRALWSVGHALKPALFTQDQPPGPLASAIPLPDLLLAALAPFWEGARVASRFALVAAVGVFPLMGWAVQRLRPAGLRLGLAALLLFEILPAPTGSVPAQPAIHPAYAWLQTQDLAGAAVIDLAAASPDRLTPLVGGEIIFATLYHRQATVAGVGSYMPAHFIALQDWFAKTPHPLRGGDFASVMRFYHARYVIVHMQSGLEPALVKEARGNPELGPAQCFPPPPGTTPWPDRLCVLEVLPSADPRFNVIRGEGWSSAEPWGTWVEGQRATATWMATTPSAEQLTLALVPGCWPNRRQHVTVFVNAQPVADHAWQDCEVWSATIPLPASLVQVGWNTLTVQADLADRPVDPASGQIIDTRRLSVAATQLLVGPP